MSDNLPTPSDYLVDPLSDISRRERRNLLASSVVGLLAARADLVPTRVSALGVDFGLIEQRAYVWVLCAVIAYFLLAFIAYGLSDYLTWDLKYKEYLRSADIKSEDWSREDQDAYDERRHLEEPIQRIYERSHRVAKLRLAFEFLVPLVVSIITILFLIFKAFQLQ